MEWAVRFTRKAAKGVGKLPVRAQNALLLLVQDIRKRGPVRGDWPNYGKLGPNRHHCHLKKGKAPTYVAVWEESDGMVRLVEVTYVGTHEKAPY